MLLNDFEAQARASKNAHDPSSRTTSTRGGPTSPVRSPFSEKPPSRSRHFLRSASSALSNFSQILKPRFSYLKLPYASQFAEKFSAGAIGPGSCDRVRLVGNRRTRGASVASGTLMPAMTRTTNDQKDHVTVKMPSPGSGEDPAASEDLTSPRNPSSQSQSSPERRHGYSQHQDEPAVFTNKGWKLSRLLRSMSQHHDHHRHDNMAGVLPVLRPRTSHASRISFMRKLFQQGAGEDRGTTPDIPARPDLRDGEVEVDDSGGTLNGTNAFSGNKDNDASSSHGDTSRSNSHVLSNGVAAARDTSSRSTRRSLLLVKPLVLLDKVDTAGRKLQRQTFSRLRNYLCSYETEQEVLRRDAWFEKHTKRWYDNVEDVADSGKKEKLISHLRGEIYDSKVHYSIYDVFEPVTMASLAAPSGGGVLTAANGHSDLRSNASANPLGGGDGKQKHPRGAGGSLSSCSIGEKPHDETGTGAHKDNNNRDSSTFVPNRALSRLSMGASHLLAVFAAWSFILGTGLWVYRKYLSASEKRLLCQVDLAVDFAYFLLGPLLCLKTTVLNVLRGVEVMGPSDLIVKLAVSDLSWWGDVLSCCLWLTLYPDYCASFVFASRHYIAMLKMVRMWRLARDPIYMLLACRTWNVGRLGRLVLSILCYGHFCGCVWFYINDQERIVLRIIEQDTIFRSGDGEVDGGNLLGTSVLVPNISPERHLLQNSLLTFFDLYAYSLQHGMIMFLGRMNSTGNSAVENLLFAIIAPIGIIIQSIIFSKINMMFMARGQHIMRQQQLLVDLKASMKMLRLPLSLRSRILSYFTYQRVHRNQDFLGVLHNSGGGRQSLQLRWQLALTLYRDLLDPDVVGGFCLPTASFASLQAIVLALTDEICLPGDYICKEGDEGTGMYFLLKGELIVSAKGEVLAVLRKGQFFGDLSLLTGLKRTASVRATTFCTLAFLSKATMAPILMKYPDQMELMASVFRNTVMQMGNNAGGGGGGGAGQVGKRHAGGAGGRRGTGGQSGVDEASSGGGVLVAGQADSGNQKEEDERTTESSSSAEDSREDVVQNHAARACSASTPQEGATVSPSGAAPEPPGPLPSAEAKDSEASPATCVAQQGDNTVRAETETDTEHHLHVLQATEEIENSMSTARRENSATICGGANEENFQVLPADEHDLQIVDYSVVNKPIPTSFPTATEDESATEMTKDPSARLDEFDAKKAEDPPAPTLLTTPPADCIPADKVEATSIKKQEVSRHHNKSHHTSSLRMNKNKNARPRPNTQRQEAQEQPAPPPYIRPTWRNSQMRREMKESMDSRKHCVDPASFSNKERWVERELWQRCEEMESEEERRLRGENLNDDEGSSSSSGSEDPTSEDESASSSEVVDEDSDEKQSGVEDLRSEAEDLLAFRSYLEVEAGRKQDPEHSSGDEVWDPNATTEEDEDSSVEQEKEEVQLDAGATHAERLGQQHADEQRAGSSVGFSASKKEDAAESSPNKTSPSTALKQSQLVFNPVSSSTDSALVVPADKKRANSREQHSAELPSRQGSRKSSRKTSATVDSRAGLTITSPNKALDGTDHEPVLTQSSPSKNHNHNYNSCGEQHQSDAITPTLAGLNLMRGISAGAASSSCGAHSSKLGSSPGSSSVGGSIVGTSVFLPEAGICVYEARRGRGGAPRCPGTSAPSSRRGTRGNNGHGRAARRGSCTNAQLGQSLGEPPPPAGVGAAAPSVTERAASGANKGKVSGSTATSLSLRGRAAGAPALTEGTNDTSRRATSTTSLEASVAPTSEAVPSNTAAIMEKELPQTATNPREKSTSLGFRARSPGASPPAPGVRQERTAPPRQEKSSKTWPTETFTAVAPDQRQVRGSLASTFKLCAKKKLMKPSVSDRIVKFVGVEPMSSSSEDIDELTGNHPPQRQY